MKSGITTREATEVLCIRADGGVSGARTAFGVLEGRLQGLRGRRFYGALWPDGSYRACVQRQPEDDPGALRLEECVLPGGRYARTTLLDWQDRSPRSDRRSTA